MEDALARKELECSADFLFGLNPCCNGRCTRTGKTLVYLGQVVRVLILVVMEDALARQRLHRKARL